MNSGEKNRAELPKTITKKYLFHVRRPKRSQSESLALSVKLKRWGIPQFGPILTLQFRKICVTHFLGMGKRKTGQAPTLHFIQLFQMLIESL